MLLWVGSIQGSTVRPIEYQHSEYKKFSTNGITKKKTFKKFLILFFTDVVGIQKIKFRKNFFELNSIRFGN